MTDSLVSTPSTKSSPPHSQPYSKITSDHLQQSAVLYVRQSTGQQLRDHQESTQRQYQLSDRLRTLGWQSHQIVVIDDDLGISGSGRQHRPGFKRLLELITQQKVGIVLGLEMSRLARNSKDWHDLFDVCAIYNVLIADEDGTFDTNDPNDRLVLGMKGIIAEMELHTMKVRLERGRVNKAERGELFHELPVGYVRDETGLPELDPDESAQHTMRSFFQLFESVGSAHGLFHHLAEQKIGLPFRDKTGRLDWRLPGKTTVYELLKHPLYAGAYGYGRKKQYGKTTRKNTGKKHLAPEQWKVLIKDQFPAYISWQQYEANQQRLQNNDQRPDRTGAARSGNALLTGIVFCGSCQRRLSPIYGSNGKGSYLCGRHRTLAHVDSCQTTIACYALDEFITRKLLEALQPAAVDLSLQVVEDEATRRRELEATRVHHVQRAKYEVELAERRYSHVDSANRLVAASLEQKWEHTLKELAKAESELADHRQQQSISLGEQERSTIQQACTDIATVWHDHPVMQDRKEITRLMIDRVVVHVHDNSERVTVILHWNGGFESCHQLTRPVSKFEQLENYDQLLERTLQLTLQGMRSPSVANILEEEGYRSPRSAKRISAGMVTKLLMHERCRTQLCNPTLLPGHWLSKDLASELSIPEKRLKDWVTRGWVTAVQRPFGRTWMLFADESELKRIRQLVSNQSGQGSHAPSETLRTPAPCSREDQ